MNQVEKSPIRKRVHRRLASNIGSVLTPKPVEPMASRTSRFEDALAPQVRLEI
ncbi:MAG TPA: hypothetical protein VE866_01620 [Candidatus Binatia bacterium]|nr:hypothetical protein [Candidatus Binatia bacterium]